MVGTAEKEPSSDMIAVSISFNGTVDQDKRFQYEVQYGEWSKFNPKHLPETYIRKGKLLLSKQEIYSPPLIPIYPGNKFAVGHPSLLLEGMELTGYVTSMGKYVDMHIMKDYQNLYLMRR